eukprot:gene26371-35009_t
MRFRARISNKDSLLLLQNISSLLEKSGDACVVQLSHTTLRLSLIVVGAAVTPRCYVELFVGLLFSECRVESQSNNIILFEIGLSQLSRALSSGKSSSSSQLKLVKRDGRPCLCFETKAHESALSIDITHDIPIKVVERMAKICKYVHLTASQTGRLVLTAEHSSSAVIKTFFTENEATVKLNLKTMSIMMNVQSMTLESASLYVTEGEMVMLYGSLSPANLGSITCYLPNCTPSRTIGEVKPGVQGQFMKQI